jgi:aryl-alcohol dehydrogenase-like predicted oxidoreductase
MLTGAISDTGSLSQDDFRRTIPKFTGDNLARNLVLVRQLEAFANARHATAGQIALAWLLAQPATIAPIPGTKRRLFLRENMQAANIVLSPEEVAALSAIFRPEVVAGARYAWGGKPS